MTSSRRRFLKHSAASACAAGMPECNRFRSPILYPSTPSLKAMSYEPSYIQAEQTGQLEKIEAELWAIYRKCRCCPRRCEVNRLEGEAGFCSSTDKLKVHSATLHFGEEKPLVGEGGSGTIFFANCNLLCCYCQNREINHHGDGR